MQKNVHENTDVRDLILLCRNRDDEAFDELVQRYTPMIRKVISQFGTSSYEYGELFSEACVALHIAVQRYNLDQCDVTFGLYSRICIRNRIVDLLRLADNDPALSEIDIEQMVDEQSVEDKLEDREIFDRIIDSAKNLLSNYEYQVLMLHIQGYKTSDIAERLSRSAKSVDNAKSRLFKRLRDEVGSISKN